ncbi:MAG: CsgG/HfaB family protein [Blastocatellia bacterium]|nr:CsgG/HfaB family protein [Blastocatellia bacterium]
MRISKISMVCLLIAAGLLFSSTFAPIFAQRQGGQDKPAGSLKEAKAKKGGKITVAVIPQAASNPWAKDITLAALEDALVASGRFAVLSRSELDSVLKEQSFSNSDLVDPNAAVKIGKALAAQYVVIAKCVSIENKSGGGGGSFGGISIGQKTQTMKVNVQMQLIDTETTQTIESQSYNDKAETKSTQTNFGGGKSDAPGEDSYREMVVKFSKNFVERLSLAVPIEALVVLIKDNRIAINAGAEQAVTEGLEMEVVEEGEPVRGPDGAVLDYDTTKVARVRVTEVKPKIAYCDVIQTFDAKGTPDAAPNVGRIQKDFLVRQVAKAAAATPPKKK